MKYRYRTDEEMKDSGVEWLGKIPKDWEVKKLKYIANIDTGNKDTQDKEESGLYPFFVRSDTVERSNSYSFDGEAILTAGDGVGVAKVFHYINGKFAYHQRVYKISDFKNIEGKYLYYYIKDNLRKEVEKISAKTTVDSLRLPMFLNFPILINEDRGKKIANFLDEKTSQFDSIISKKEELIKKLEEAKKSLISEVVTGQAKVVKTDDGYELVKRSSNEMKYSGVEYIGNISKDWKVSRIKIFTTLKSIKNKPELELLSLYRDHGVVPKNSRADNNNRPSEDLSGYKLVEINDLVLNKMKVWQGSLAVSKYEGIVSPAYIICSINLDMMDPRYVHYLLRNKLYIPEYRRLSTGIRPDQWDINYDNFKNIKAIIPDIIEQKNIVEFIDSKVENIDNLYNKIKLQIEKLKEAKQSLISEAVTGKIEMLD